MDILQVTAALSEQFHSAVTRDKLDKAVRGGGSPAQGKVVLVRSLLPSLL